MKRLFPLEGLGLRVYKGLRVEGLGLSLGVSGCKTSRIEGSRIQGLRLLIVGALGSNMQGFRITLLRV